jgi:hypothetical protein
MVFSFWGFYDVPYRLGREHSNGEDMMPLSLIGGTNFTMFSGSTLRDSNKASTGSSGRKPAWLPAGAHCQHPNERFSAVFTGRERKPFRGD